MKFFSVVVAAVAALASVSEAKIDAKDHKAWKEQLNHRAKNNMFDKKTILAGAKPYNEAAKKFAERKLQQQ